jgi:hypothetical protein
MYIKFTFNKNVEFDSDVVVKYKWYDIAPRWYEVVLD